MDKVRELLTHNVTFNILIREYMGDRAMHLVKHHLLFLNGTAKQRYEYLIATNPSLFKKFPLRFIASMIGITPTQLGRNTEIKSKIRLISQHLLMDLHAGLPYLCCQK